jgi:hypothetical protein
VGAVRGHDYAAAYVVGDWVGDIEAGDDAGAGALGGFNGNITAGASGYVISEGNAGASITAARRRRKRGQVHLSRPEKGGALKGVKALSWANVRFC